MIQNQQRSAIQFKYKALDSVSLGGPAPSGLAAAVQNLGSRRVLLIGSSSLATKTDNFASIKRAVEATAKGVELETFSEIRAHTPREDVLDAIALANDFGADLLVSVGGGSVIDACKVVQLALDQGLSNAAQLLEYAQGANGSRGVKAGDMTIFKGPSKIRQIAIPTTLSGAEFSNNAGVLNTEQSTKEGYKGLDLCAKEILYDPELATMTPEWLWLSTAIRSLDHAVEGYCSKDAHPFVQGHFLHAMKLFAESLPETKADPLNLQARSLNQQAVWLACVGLGDISHGASHGIGYILGSLCGVPHGYTSCVMLPAVLEWNSKKFFQQQQAIANALGCPEMSASHAVKNLIAKLGLPTSLAEVGVEESQFAEIAARAFAHPVVKNNPRTISTKEDVTEILQLAC
jgi:maleylacetate reductase